MKTSLTVSKDYEGIKFSGVIAFADLARLNLDSFDRLLLTDLGVSSPAEDHLLAFEMLFRRLKEQLGG